MIEQLNAMVDEELPEWRRVTVADRDGFLVFDKWLIIPTRHSAQLLDRNGEILHEFPLKSLATAWCILEHRQNYQQSTQLKLLSDSLIRYTNNLLFYENNLRKTTDFDRRDILRIRVFEDKAKIEQAQRELKKLLGQAKYIQIRGFQNETARTFSKQDNTDRKSSDRKPLRGKDRVPKSRTDSDKKHAGKSARTHRRTSRSS